MLTDRRRAKGENSFVERSLCLFPGGEVFFAFTAVVIREIVLSSVVTDSTDIESGCALQNHPLRYPFAEMIQIGARVGIVFPEIFPNRESRMEKMGDLRLVVGQDQVEGEILIQ